MNWRVLPHIVRGFYTRSFILLMLLPVAFMGVCATMIFREPPNRGISFKMLHRWSPDYAGYRPNMRLSLNRTEIEAGGPFPNAAQIRYLDLANLRLGPDGRSLHYQSEPFERRHLEIVRQFPNLVALKIQSALNSDAMPGLEGAKGLQTLELWDVGGRSERFTLAQLPFLPQLDCVLLSGGTRHDALDGLARNNPQVSRVELRDILPEQRGLNSLHLAELTQLTEVVVSPAFEKSDGPPLMPLYRPEGPPVLSAGWTYSAPSPELLAALQSLPRLRRVYCHDDAIRGWGLDAVRAALPGTVAVEPGMALSTNGPGVFPLIAFLFPIAFFTTFVVSMQSGATFAHQLSAVVPGYARPHLLVYGVIFAAVVGVYTVVISRVVGVWTVSLVACLFELGLFLLLTCAGSMQVRPAWFRYTVQYLSFPVFMGIALVPTLLVGAGEEGPKNTLLQVLVAPPPWLQLLAGGLGLASIAYVLGSLPRLASRLQEAGSKHLFVHPFDSAGTSRIDSAAEAAALNPMAYKLRDWLMGTIPDLDKVSLYDRPLSGTLLTRHLGRVWGQAPLVQFVFATLLPLLALPILAIVYRESLAQGDFTGAILRHMAFLGRALTVGLLVIVGIRIINRKPYCPYESTLPVERGEYLRSLSATFDRPMALVLGLYLAWWLLGTVAQWHDGSLPRAWIVAAQPIAFAFLILAERELCRWAMSINSLNLQTMIAIFLGVPLAQATIGVGGFSPLDHMQFLDNLLASVALGGNLVAWLVLLGINRYRYPRLEWGRVV
jgi:hypothetical protein